MNFDTLIENDKKYIANTYSRFPISIESGSGSIVFDKNGKKYIDLGSGIAVSSFGICDRTFAEAVYAQCLKLTHVSNLYYSEPQVLLAESLCEKTGFKKVFFSNSGAEANECAIKTARKYSHDKYGDGRNTILTLNHGFHGRTMATITATGQPEYHTHFMPFNEGFDYMEPGDIGELEEKVKSGNVCAIMLEVIQGEGGVNIIDKKYLQKVCQISRENDIIFIIDEVQSGNGRTGKYFAFEHFDIKPDIVTTAKGLGAGLPIGATLFGEKTEATLTYGTHGSTFGGNPIAAAGALTVVKRIDNSLLRGVNERSSLIFDTFSKARGVKSVSGLGLMVGIETEEKPSDIAKRAMNMGVLVLTAKAKLRLLPALNIPIAQLREGCEILRNAI